MMFSSCPFCLSELKPSYELEQDKFPHFRCPNYHKCFHRFEFGLNPHNKKETLFVQSAFHIQNHTYYIIASNEHTYFAKRHYTDTYDEFSSQIPNTLHDWDWNNPDELIKQIKLILTYL